MLEIFKFYIGIVVQIFNRVLQSVQVSSNLTYGTFLLGCGLFVVFINLLKFQLGTHGINEIKGYRNKQLQKKEKYSRNLSAFNESVRNYYRR